ncbi:MAG: FMN-binding protein [Candidatus Omnitrophica bacterium]|nr:FMN-binding protein [Candidatus Omnitrophota bacterium]
MCRMSKKLLLLAAAGAGVLFLTSQANAYQTLATQDQALQMVLGTGVQITPIVKKLVSHEEKREVERKLGDRLVYKSPVGENWGVEPTTTFTFYKGTRDGKEVGVALIDVEPGRWGQNTFMIGLNPDGSVKRVVVMKYREQWGRPIANKVWLKQFIGKNIKSPIEVGKDIDSVSGATISSSSAAFAVKKAVALYWALFLK